MYLLAIIDVTLYYRITCESTYFDLLDEMTHEFESFWHPDRFSSVSMMMYRFTWCGSDIAPHLLAQQSAHSEVWGASENLSYIKQPCASNGQYYKQGLVSLPRSAELLSTD
jgi:hypothetical protein